MGPRTARLQGNGEDCNNEEFYVLYASPNIWVIKSRRLRWAGHVARVGDRRGLYSVLVGDLRERDNLEDIGVGGRIIIKGVFRRWDAEAWTGSILLGVRDRWRALVDEVMDLRVP